MKKLYACLLLFFTCNTIYTKTIMKQTFYYSKQAYNYIFPNSLYKALAIIKIATVYKTWDYYQEHQNELNKLNNLLQKALQEKNKFKTFLFSTVLIGGICGVCTHRIQKTSPKITIQKICQQAKTTQEAITLLKIHGYTKKDFKKAQISSHTFTNQEQKFIQSQL